MKTPPRATLIAAVVIAAATGVLTVNYVSSVGRTQAAQAEPQLRILVAKDDIPARITIETSMLRRVSRPISQVEPGAVIDAHKVIGLLSLVSLPAGSTITASRIGRPQTVALAVVLKRGMRAVSIGIDRVKAVGGLIQPGDRVDVIAVAPRVADETPQGKTIVTGALVLASGTQMESAVQPTAQPGQQDSQSLTTVTLAVTPAQADLLAAADINATLRLALRSPQDPVGGTPPERFILPKAPESRAATAHVAQAPLPIAVVAAPAAAPAARPQPAARPRRAAPNGGVEIIEGRPTASSSGGS